MPADDAARYMNLSFQSFLSFSLLDQWHRLWFQRFSLLLFMICMIIWIFVFIVILIVSYKSYWYYVHLLGPVFVSFPNHGLIMSTYKTKRMTYEHTKDTRSITNAHDNCLNLQEHCRWKKIYITNHGRNQIYVKKARKSRWISHFHYSCASIWFCYGIFGA